MSKWETHRLEKFERPIPKIKVTMDSELEYVGDPLDFGEAIVSPVFATPTFMLDSQYTSSSSPGSVAPLFNSSHSHVEGSILEAGNPISRKAPQTAAPSGSGFGVQPLHRRAASESRGRTHTNMTQGPGLSPNPAGPALGSPSFERLPQRRYSARNHIRSASFSVENAHVLNSPGPWRSGEKFRFPLSQTMDEGHWGTIYEFGREYRKERCTAWRDEIDKVIIFAALFAATVVAFLVVSYTMLKEDPQDIQDEYLRYFASQSHIFFVAFASGNLSQAQFTSPPSNINNATLFHPSASVVRQNGAMFLSMTIALSTVLLGTTCLQWIREYERDTRLGPKEAAALQQMRLDGINYWRVPFLVSSLPILLQCAVGLFFWGLCEFLWRLNTTITTLNLIVIVIVCFFVVATFALPAMQSILITPNGMKGHQVPYKSPQARWFGIIAFWWARTSVWFLLLWLPDNEFLKNKKVFLKKLSRTLTAKWEDWVAFDTEWQAARLVHLPKISAQESRDVPRVVAWLASTHVYSQKAIGAIYGVLREMYPSTSMQVLRRLMTRPSGHQQPPPELVEKFVRDWKDLDSPGFSSSRNRRAGSMDEDVLMDVKSALLLDRLVKDNPQFRMGLLDIRTELLVRIINHNARSSGGSGANSPTGAGTASGVLDVWKMFETRGRDINNPKADDEEKWDFWLLVPFTQPEDYSRISDKLKEQLISCFREYLRCTSYRPILWKAILPLVIKTATSQPELSVELIAELNCLNGDLVAFQGRISSVEPSQGSPLPDLCQYIHGYQAAKLEAPSGSNSARRSQDTTDRLGPFETQMEDLRLSVGYPANLDIYPPMQPPSPEADVRKRRQKRRPTVTIPFL